MIEFTFAEPLEVRHPETGELLIYAGRTDAIMQHQDSGLFILDDKTTGSLGSLWAKQWELRGQFTGYCWAARKIDYKVDGVIIRGVGILKTKYTHAQAGPLYRPEWMVDEWWTSVHETLTRIIHSWKRGHFQPDFSESCTAYGGCQFVQACTTSPDFRDGMLSALYVEREWNPLAPQR